MSMGNEQKTSGMRSIEVTKPFAEGCVMMNSLEISWRLGRRSVFVSFRGTSIREMRGVVICQAVCGAQEKRARLISIREKRIITRD